MTVIAEWQSIQFIANDAPLRKVLVEQADEAGGVVADLEVNHLVDDHILEALRGGLASSRLSRMLLASTLQLPQRVFMR